MHAPHQPTLFALARGRTVFRHPVTGDLEHWREAARFCGLTPEQIQLGQPTWPESSQAKAPTHQITEAASQDILQSPRSPART